MADYYLKIAGTEYGPVPFLDLIDQVRAGEITPDVLVRQTDSNAWLPAEEIPGLFRQAKKIRQEVAVESASPLQANAAATKVNPKRKRPAESSTAADDTHDSAEAMVHSEPVSATGKMDAAQIAMITVVGLMVAGTLWWFTRTERFPQPVMPALAAGMEFPLEDMKAPPVDPPTLDVPVGEPMLVPGLELETNTSSPSLSADLLKIAYLKPTRGEDDIYIAERSAKDQPFQKPVKLKCSTPANEQFCSLSADGTQLLFTIQGTPSKLHLASSSDGFATSIPVQFEGLDLENDNVDNAEWLSDNTFKFATGDPMYTRRKQYVAEINFDQHIAHVTSEIPLQNPWPRTHFSANLERGYFANKMGILITAPKVEMDEIGMGLILFDSMIIGQVDEALDDPVFVVPQEDVIFYSGVGPSTGKKPGGRNRLWMIRI